MPFLRGEFFVLVLVALALAVGEYGSSDATSSPSDAPAAETAPARFSSVFRQAGRVGLDESSGRPIGDVTALATGPDGRLGVVDGQSARVILFGADGGRIADAGRRGDGPAEFSRPVGATFDSRGRLYVSDTGRPRLVRFTRDLAFDTAFRLDGAYYAMDLAPADSGILAFVNAPGVTSLRVRRLASDGTELSRFHPSRPEYREVPYWEAATERVLASAEDHVVAGGNLRYPLVLYDEDGVFVDSVGSPPPSWEPAPRLERGAFAGPDQLRRFEEWRRTFTTIQEAAFVEGGEYLVVAHRYLDPEVLAYEKADYRADVYRTEDWRKLWADVPLPGPVLSGGAYLNVLLTTPPGGWAVGRYEIRG